jgi:RNA polymerase sigma factor (sigma-70 family)
MLRLDTELYRYFYHRVRQTEDAEELVSTTWLAAGKNYKHLSSLRHFLFGVAYRVLVDWRRRRSRRVATETVDIDELPTSFRKLDSLLVSAERKDEVDRCIAQLPECYREVVRLALSGHKNREIAAILQLRRNTTRSRLSRGMALLRQLLESSQKVAR